MDATPAGGVELIGFEIESQATGRLWLGGVDRVVLYGRNGAGKSTVLRTMCALLAGDGTRSDDETARVYLRMPADSLANLEWSLIRAVDEVLGPQVIGFESAIPRLHLAEMFGLRSWPGKASVPSRADEAELARDLEGIARSLEHAILTSPELADLHGTWLQDLPSQMIALYRELQTRSPNRAPLRMYNALTDAFDDAVGSYRASSEALEAAAAKFGLELANSNAFVTWDARTRSRSWHDICRVWAAARLLELEDEIRENRLEAMRTGEDPDPAPEDDPELAGLLGASLEACCRDGIVALRPSGTPAKPAWSMLPAFDLAEPACRSLAALLQFGYPRVGVDQVEDFILAEWSGRGDPSYRGRPTADHRFCPAPIGAEIKVDDFPLRLVNLDAEFDLRDELGAALGWSEMNASLLFDRHGVEAELPAMVSAEEVVAKGSSILEELDLGLRGLRLRPTGRLGEWVAGKPLIVEAFDVRSESWQAVESLSSAQQRWIRRAIQLAQAERAGFPAIVVCDEPESGVHESSVARIFDHLARVQSRLLLASHHPRALTRSEFSVVHVDRSATGVALRPPVMGDDLAKLAERLGVLPIDLLAMKRLMIVVEGSHDEAVIRRLIGLSSYDRTASSVLVAPVRGVKNVASVASSEILVSFTRMHFLVITDNARTDVFKQVIEDASAAIKTSGHRQAAQLAGVVALRAHASPEERYVLDLIERAIQFRIIDRLRFFGLPVHDVIELFDPAAFRLTESWAELRAEFGSGRPDFKKWLRSTKGASIGVNKVEKAFDGLPVLPEVLQTLLQEIEIAVDVAMLG